MIDLKPCPFCGEQAIRVSHPGMNWDGKKEHMNIGACHNTWYVGCPFPFFEGLVKHCDVHPSASWFVSLEEAERVWNERFGL